MGLLDQIGLSIPIFMLPRETFFQRIFDCCRRAAARLPNKVCPGPCDSTGKHASVDSSFLFQEASKVTWWCWCGADAGAGGACGGGLVVGGLMGRWWCLLISDFFAWFSDKNLSIFFPYLYYKNRRGIARAARCESPARTRAGRIRQAKIIGFRPRRFPSKRILTGVPQPDLQVPGPYTSPLF